MESGPSQAQLGEEIKAGAVLKPPFHTLAAMRVLGAKVGGVAL